MNRGPTLGKLPPTYNFVLNPYPNDFATYYQELRMRQTGWYREGEKPPVRKPPPSQEWIKR